MENGYFYCPNCRKVKPLDDFSINTHYCELEDLPAELEVFDLAIAVDIKHKNREYVLVCEECKDIREG